MKYLILDDSEYKRKRVSEYIHEIDKNAEIEEFSCSCDFIGFLKEKDYIRSKKEEMKDYILFLDWVFPFYHNELPKRGEGEHILITLSIRNIPLKTVIISSEKVEDLDEYENVLGQVIDDSSIYQKSEYENFINIANGGDINEE